MNKCPTCKEEMDDYHVPAFCRIAELEAENAELQEKLLHYIELHSKAYWR